MENVSFPRARQTIAIVEVDQQNGNLDQVPQSIGLLRSLMPEGKLALLLETNAGIDLKCVLPLSPDACLVNAASRSVLLKTLELTLMGQRTFVLGASVSTSMKEGDKVSNPASLRSSSSAYRFGRHTLSSRECQILGWLAEGKSKQSNRAAGNLSESTVKAHLKTIRRKTYTQNRTQAAIWAIERGFGGACSELNDSVVAAHPPHLLLER